MKKLLITLSMLAAGVSVFCALQNARARVSQAAAETRQAWLAQTQMVAQARSQQVELQERVKDLSWQLSVQRTAVPATVSTPSLLACNRTNLSPAQSEQLLSELGFDWNRTGDYLVVSKASLATMSLKAMNGMKLTDTACKVLAITPEERSAVEAMTQQLGADYNARAQSAVLREEPAGDVLAKYTMPTDPAFSQSLSNRFCAGIQAILGPERSELLQQYAYSWMGELGMFGGESTTLTVKRYPAGQSPGLNVEIRGARGTMSTSVSPWQPFPETFRSLFPGGWVDLAQREGFELPETFHKK